MRFVLDAQPLAIKTIHALRYIHVLTVKKTMHRITKIAVFINESMIFSILEYHRMYLFLKLVQFIKKTHGQRVMNYAGATKAPIQCTAVSTQTDMSWVGAQPVTRKQRPAASVTSRPVPSVSRSVGTTTRVADVKKTVAPVKSSSRRRIHNQANLLHQRFVLIKSLMLLILLLKHTRGKVRRIPLLPVCTSPP